MFPRIALVTDLTEASTRLVQCTLGLRTMGVREVVLTYSMNLPFMSGLAESVLRILAPQLEKQRSLLEEAGFSVSIELAAGHPESAVNRVAEERDCSAIVVDAAVHSRFEEVVFGLVAGSVVQGARRPVLVVRLEQCDGGCDTCCKALPCTPLEHVVFPTDFSDNAERAFGYVEKAVEIGATCITLVHVQDRVRIGKHLENRLDEFNRIDRARLERMKARLMEKGAREVDIEIPYGSPVEEILAVARRPGVSLLVMGSQGRGFIRTVFLGSVSNHVVRQSPVSVLLIPTLRQQR